MAEVAQPSPSTPNTRPESPAQDAPNTPSTALTTTTTTSRPPEALATTKRKFHSLLESITRGSASKPAPSTSSFSSTTFDSPAKRIRIEARKRLESSTPSTTSPTSAYIQSQLLSSRLAAARRKVSACSTAPATGGSDTTQTEPNYLPWSHEAFLRRLKTFADLSLWTSKPEGVNEVAWAKRGWVCAGVNTVACRGGCEKRVVVALRRPRKDEAGKEIQGSEDYSVDIEDELVRRYVELIASGHEESCPWRENGCRDDIYRLQIARPTIWQPQLRERYDSFTAIASALPELATLQLPFEVATVVKQFPPDFFQSNEPSAKEPANTDTAPHQTAASHLAPAQAIRGVNLTALAFALLGWQGSADLQYAIPPQSSLTSPPHPIPVPTSAIATCHTCFRRLGLWLYCAPLSERTHTSADTPAISTADAAQVPDNAETQTIPPPQRPAPPVPASIPPLDLATNHRTYCPWISSTSQHMPGSFSGLSIHEILLRLISNTFPSSYISSNTTRAGATIGDGETSGLLSSHGDRPATRDGTASVRGTTTIKSSNTSTTPYLSQDFQASTTTLHERPLSMMASTIRTVSSTDGLSIHSTTASYGDGDDENRLQEHGIGIPSEDSRSTSKKRKKERGEVEREDKARFARLKELGRAIGLGSIKRKKAA